MRDSGRAELYPAVAWLDRRPRWQWRFVIAIVAAYLLWRIVRIAAGIMLDRWWYDTVTDAPVWSTITVAKVQLALAAGIVTAVVLGINLRLVFRSRAVSSAVTPGGVRPRAPSPSDPLAVAPPADAYGVIASTMVRRYRRRIGPAHRWILIAVVAVIVWRVTLAAMGQWQPWVLFRDGPSLDTDVPELGGDVGYHLFKLPFLAVASAWLRQLVVVAFAIAVVGHVLSGSLRLPLRGHRSSRLAIGHLAMLAATFAALSALDYVIVRRPSLATARFGSFTGAGYTEVNVLAPAMWLLALVAVAVGFLMVNGVRTRRWRLPLVALGAWAALHLVLVVAAPPLVDRYIVQPAEGDRQLPYVQHNREATRAAIRLDAVDVEEVQLADGIADVPAADLEAVDGVPLFTRDQMVSPLQVLRGTTATRISDVDLDRYELDGERRPLLLGARNASRSDLPERGWVQDHLVYTHGDGVVAVPADEPAPDGRPDVNALDGVLTPQRPQLYFGEGLRGWYAIVGTKRAEFDGTTYAADSGIDVGSLFRRATLSIVTGDIQPLFSSELTADSQLLFRRDVKERLETLAPFLSFDGDPYPVVTAEGVTWIVTGYTTSSRYPYAQAAPTALLPASSGISGHPNYVHASVKATVDAYDGTVHLYRAEDAAQDPILAAWDDVFPELLEPIDDMPDELRQHLHYPSDLFTLQNGLLGSYHVDSAELLFSGAEEWSVAGAASSGVGQQGAGPAPAVWSFLPGATGARADWLSILPYNPGDSSNPSSTRNELAALAVGDHDDPDVLRLAVVSNEGDRQVATPLVAQSAIDADAELARAFTLLNANGSKVQFGPMTPLPLQGGLAYIRPIVVTGTADTTAPRLYGVVAVSDGFVGLGDDVPSALAEAVAASSDDP